MKRDWVAVDLDGLKKILQRRGMEFVLYELIQNAWDEDATRVDVAFTWQNGIATLNCTDDSPEGFRDLADAFTLYKESYKKTQATKRGLFNAGEKFVLALCEEASVCSTKGTVLFSKDGARRRIRTSRETGTNFTAVIKMLKRDYDHICKAISLLIPPIPTFFNGTALQSRTPLCSFEVTLPTVLATEDGTLAPSKRKTEVRVYEPLAGETASLYEMGIPVVDTDDKWHVDVQQKVPLNIERDNVTPAYLRSVRVAVLNAMAERLQKEDATATWVKEAMGDYRTEAPAVEKVIGLRFGDKRVTYDPSDPEANNRAVAAGYTVIAPGSLNWDEWANVKKYSASLPAGQVTPTPKPFSPGGEPLQTIDPKDQTEDMKWFVQFVHKVAPALIGVQVSVMIANDFNWHTVACFGGTEFYINVARVGHKFFKERGGVRMLSLIIHELAHHRVSNHLSEDYYDELSDLGAKLTALALQKPELFTC